MILYALEEIFPAINLKMWNVEVQGRGASFASNTKNIHKVHRNLHNKEGNLCSSLQVELGQLIKG